MATKLQKFWQVRNFAKKKLTGMRVNLIMTLTQDRASLSLIEQKYIREAANALDITLSQWESQSNRLKESIKNDIRKEV